MDDVRQGARHRSRRGRFGWVGVLVASPGKKHTYTPLIGQTILGARRVGAKLRDCAAAAGVPWSTFCDWRRAWRNGDDRFGQLFEDLDRAASAYRQVLRARILKGTEKDARLAFDLLRWEDVRTNSALDLKARKLDVEIKQAQLAALKADAESGTTTDAFDALARLIARRVADAKPDAESDVAGDAEP